MNILYTTLEPNILTDIVEGVFIYKNSLFGNMLVPFEIYIRKSIAYMDI